MLVVASGIISMIASPLLATIDVHQSYWLAAFWAMILSPVNADGALAIPFTFVILNTRVFANRLSAIHRREPRHL